MYSRAEQVLLVCLLALACCFEARAATYTVGPAGSGRNYTSLATLLAQVNLQPGDVVVVDGDATYLGSGAVGFRLDSEDGGAQGNPVRITGAVINGKRPILSMSQGDHVLKIERANHVVIEGFEITSGGGGTRSCVFSEAHDVVLRDLIIRDCKAHGVLAADKNSGSLTLEYSEIYNAGAGELRHPIYVTSDAAQYPQAVFRMQFNYVHDGNGGNLLKSRHHRNEIYSNWLENARYQEIELIGPDCEAWGGTPPAIEGNSDVVGNVVIHRSDWANTVRVGGDLNGRSRGVVRMVNNTILINRAGAATAVMVQLGLKALDMHNNLIHQPGGSPVVIRENAGAGAPSCGYQDTRPWVDGVRRVSGEKNWVQTGAMQVPTTSEWIGTLRAGDPGLTSLESAQIRPRADSVLRSAGTAIPRDVPGIAPFPDPLVVPAYDPPYRTRQAPGAAVRRSWSGSPSIGAFEPALSDFIRMNGSMPLIPNQPNNVFTQSSAVMRVPRLRAGDGNSTSREHSSRELLPLPAALPAPCARDSALLARLRELVMPAWRKRHPSSCTDD